MKKRTFAQLRKFATVIEKPKKNQNVSKIHQSDLCDCTRRAYHQFLEEGLGSGPEEKYYQITDQRFLGDEGFVARVASKAKNKEIRPSGPGWVQARRQLVHLMREWANLTTQ